MYDGVIGIARHIKYLRVPAVLAHAVHQLTPAHAWHHDLRHKQMDQYPAKISLPGNQKAPDPVVQSLDLSLNVRQLLTETWTNHS